MKKMATLSSEGDMTSFSYADINIRFRTSSHLVRYTKILDWDNGYIVVMACYDNSDEDEEDYIDLYPILTNLYIDPKEFLRDIEEVCLDYD